MVKGVGYRFMPWEITRAKLMLGWIAKERALEKEVRTLLHSYSTVRTLLA
jgi:hypothetical protein